MQKNICNNTVTKDPTTPHICRYTTFWNVSVLKVTIETRRPLGSITFKKLTTGNNVFNCFSYYLLHPAVLTSNVQCVLSAARPRTLKMCCQRSRLVFNCCFKETDISEGSLATHFRRSGICSGSITDVLLILIVK